MNELTDIALAHRLLGEALEALEAVAKINCPHSEHGTNAMHFEGDKMALRVLAKHGRFRIVTDDGRTLSGFWPEHDPECKK